ncbi:MAG TPA: PAS domain S-box protein [Desulfotignum sp.]|nr:PAS domain S-box protein [Desulfotignum sp.]
MTTPKTSFFNRILFKILVPVVIIGIIFSTLIVTFLSSPMKDFLTRQFDANLSLASVTGLRICEDSFNYLLDLRMEQNRKMNQVLQNEALDKIKTASRQFPHIHLLVVASGRYIQAGSWENTPKQWEGSPLHGRNNVTLQCHINGRAARAHVQFFPYWDWHIIGFVFEDDYKSPIKMAYTATYLSSAGVFLAMLVTLVAVFFLFINKPLQRLIFATNDIAGGKFSRMDSIVPDEFGQLMTAFNSMVASLENKQAAVNSLIHQLKESEALFRSQFEFGNIGIAITSPDKGWIRANDRLCRMLGYSEEELRQKTWPDMTHPDDLRVDMASYNSLLAGEIDSYEMEKRFFHKNKNIVFTHLNVSCFRNPDQSVKFIIASLLDISDRKQAEAEKKKLDLQLAQAQKMEAIGTLAGGIAHDFNNMLGVISGRAELGLQKSSPTDPVYKDLEQIHNAAGRSTDITRQLLAFARKQTISPKVIDLNHTVGNMIKMLGRLLGEDIDLLWQPADDLWSVKIDPSQLDQILVNLCVNARDAIADVGKITIETGMKVFDPAYCATHAGFVPGKFVLLAVSDDGCGMDRHTLDNLFEPFFTTKETGRGTGLGLATVYGIVKQNNGFINVYSEPEKGTSFRIYLPPHSAAMPEKIQEKTAAPMPRGSGETLLVVEDDAAILDMLETMLKSLHYTILTADSPSRALAAAQSHKGRIHLVITDVVMPEMNGRDLAEKLSALYPDINILFMSGYTANVIAHQGVLEEGVHFIQKPFSMQDMAAKIHEVLGVRS